MPYIAGTIGRQDSRLRNQEYSLGIGRKRSEEGVVSNMTMTDIDAALDMLQEAVDKEIALARREGAKAFELGDHSQVEKQMKRSKELEGFQKQVATLSKTYRSIRSSRSKRRKLQRGTSTPQEAYYEPILQVLKQMGGRGKSSEVIDRVGEIMRPKLKEADYGKLKEGSIRWQTRCRFARWYMVQQGQLRSDSPRGTWEIAVPS